MQIFFVFSLIFAILVSLFAVMNSEPVTITLLWKQFRFSQAIVILGSAAVGAVVVAFLGIVNKIKSSLKIRELNNKIKQLEKQVEELKKEDLTPEINKEMKMVEENNQEITEESTTVEDNNLE